MINPKIIARLDTCLAHLNTLHNRLGLDLDLFYVEAVEQLLKSVKYELHDNIQDNNNSNNNDNRG